jgi:PKD repeat protein
MTGHRLTLPRPARRLALAGLGAIVVLAGLAGTVGTANALPDTSSPTLQLDRTIRTNPFNGTSTKMTDAEGSAYVPSDDSLWLMDDVAKKAHEVNRTTGALKRTLSQSDFAAAPRFGGGGTAGNNRTVDLESLAYDPTTDTLYAFNGKCCTSSVIPAAFRLTRGGDNKFHVESYQPLPSGSDYTAAAVRPTDGKLYLAVNSSLRQYTYTTNTLGSNFSISGVSGILGLGFSSDGADLAVVTTGTKLLRADWSSKAVVSGWNFNLSSFGVGDSRAVELVDDQFYVLDGYDSRPSSDPLKYAVYVFGVQGSGSGSPPTANFRATPRSGDSPLTVSFKDRSTGNPTSWLWNFGDGTTSTQQNPSHTYTQPNTYSVSLTATNAGGSHTRTKNNHIVVSGTDNTPPDTFIDSGPSGTTSSTSATFTFSATEASTFECRLDGGGFGTCASPQTYSPLGTGSHTFEVRATDGSDNVDQSPASRTWTVAPGGAPIARQTIATAVNGTATNAITIATPAGATSGDVLVACIAINGGTVNGVPPGWTSLAAITSITNPRVYGYYKVVGAPEPSQTWTFTNPVANGGGIARYSGVSTTTPIDAPVSTGSSATETTAATVPGVTTATAGAMVVGCVGANSSSAGLAIGTPAGMTEAWDVAGKRNELADAVQSGVGPSGDKTWTLSSGRAFGGWLAALRPA